MTGAAPRAEAFGSKGHEVLEAVAYRRLAAMPEVTDSHGRKRSGQAVLRYLIERGALIEPECFDPGDEGCQVDRERGSLRWWPVLGTGTPDMVLSRQVTGNGQCYHFMAQPEDAWSTAVDPRLHVPSGLSGKAYQRCIGVLSDLWDGYVLEPRESNRFFRGIYAIMHAVEDSYSPAHAERDPTWRVLYLKPWALRAWWDYFWHGDGTQWAYLNGPSHHGAIKDIRDDDFIVDSPRCRDIPQPYAMPESCLSSRGDRAAGALVDLLVTTYRVLSWIERAPKDRARARAHARKEFHAYVARQLPPVYGEATNAPLPEKDIAWTMLGAAGARFRYQPSRDAFDTTAVLGLNSPFGSTFPLQTRTTLELGARWRDGEPSITFGIEPISLLLPLADWLAFGTTPLTLHWYRDEEDRFVFHPGANWLRLDLLPTRRIWLSGSWLTYSWVRREVDPRDFQVSLGVAWNDLDRLQLSQWIDNLTSSADPVQKPGACAPRPPRNELPERCRMPALGRDYRRTKRTLVISGSAAMLEAPRSFRLWAEGLLWDRNRLDERSGFSPGLEAGAALRVDEGEQLLGGVLGPMARVYIIPDWLALALHPARFEVGAESSDQEETRAYWDAGAQAGLVLMFGNLELGLETPVLSWRELDRMRGTNLGVRLGVSLGRPTGTGAGILQP